MMNETPNRRAPEMKRRKRQSINRTSLEHNWVMKTPNVLNWPGTPNMDGNPYEIYVSPMKELQSTTMISAQRAIKRESSVDSNSELADAMLFRDVPAKYLAFIRDKENTNVRKMRKRGAKQKLSSSEDETLSAKRIFVSKNNNAARAASKSPRKFHSQTEHTLNVSTPTCYSEMLWNDYVCKRYSQTGSNLPADKQQNTQWSDAGVNNAKCENGNNRPWKFFEIEEMSKVGKAQLSKTKFAKSDSDQDLDEYAFPAAESRKRRKNTNIAETFAEFRRRRQEKKAKLDKTSTRLISLDNLTDSDEPKTEFTHTQENKSRQSKEDIGSGGVRGRDFQFCPRAQPQNNTATPSLVSFTLSDSSKSLRTSQDVLYSRVSELRKKIAEDHYSSRKDLMKARNELREKFGRSERTLDCSRHIAKDHYSLSDGLARARNELREKFGQAPETSSRSRRMVEAIVENARPKPADRLHAAVSKCMDRLQTENVVKTQTQRSQTRASGKPRLVSVKILTDNEMFRTVRHDKTQYL